MTAGMPRILVVDDEPPIRKFLRISLAAKQFDVVEAGNGADALHELEGNRLDLVLLDLGLPDVRGEELIHAIRAVSSLPIIVLSVRAEERQKIAAFDAGASDYVTKPFSIGELTARIRAALRDRRAAPPPGPVFEVGRVRVDVARHRVLLDGNEIRLTPKEFDLLAVLVVNHGRIVTHRQLLSELWGKTHEGDTQYLRVYVGQLRQKLGDDPADPHFIANEPGIGYRFLDPA
jgi:two-component system, OmpR family, KDP operon response regulator KdpE